MRHSLLLFFIFFLSCGAEEATSPVVEKCTYPFTGNVTLAPKFASLSDVEEIEYTTRADSNLITLDLIDGEGNKLDKAEEIQHVEALGEIPAGAIQRKIGNLSIDSYIIEKNDNEYDLHFVVKKDGVLRLNIVADFNNIRCQEASKSLHFCAPQIESEHAFLFPSCGFDIDTRIARGDKPKLESLRLEVLSKEKIAGSDGVKHTKNQTFSIFNAITNQTIREKSDIKSFIESANLTGLFTDISYQRLLTIMGDKSWDRDLVKQISVCSVNRYVKSERSVQISKALKPCGERSRDAFSKRKTSAGIKGDPHFNTFDDRYYSFQARGDFLLSQRSGAYPFETQVRLAPMNAKNDAVICEKVTWPVAGTIRFRENDILRFHVTERATMEVSLNQEELKMSDLKTFKEGYSITREMNILKLSFPDTSEIEVIKYGWTLSIAITRPEGDTHIYRGLLGDTDLEPKNDLVGLNDTVLQSPVSTKTQRESLRPQWTLNAENSNFLTAPFKDSTLFSDPDFPKENLALDGLPQDERKALTEQCNKSGSAQLLDCMLDLYCSPGDPFDMDKLSGTKGKLADRSSGFSLEGAIREGLFREDNNFNTQVNNLICADSPAEGLEILKEKSATLDEVIDLQVLETSKPQQLGETTLAIGHSYQSFFVVLAGQESKAQGLRGKIHFDQPIIGIVHPNLIQRTHKLFLPEGVQIDGDFRSLEKEERLEISKDLKTLSFTFYKQESPMAFRILLEQK